MKLLRDEAASSKVCWASYEIAAAGDLGCGTDDGRAVSRAGGEQGGERLCFASGQGTGRRCSLQPKFYVRWGWPRKADFTSQEPTHRCNTHSRPNSVILGRPAPLFRADLAAPWSVRRLMETDSGLGYGAWRRSQHTARGLRRPCAGSVRRGRGFGFVELGIVLEETGRALVCAPYFSSTVLATSAVLNGADEAGRSRPSCRGWHAGDTVAALAFTEPDGQWDQAGIETTARQPRPLPAVRCEEVSS